MTSARAAERPDRDRTIVVGIDGTEDGHRALRYAAARACRQGQAIRLVHVSNDPLVYAPLTPYVPDDAFEGIGTAILEAAEQQARDLQLDPSRLSTRLLRGPRIPALLDELEDASCIVLGTRASEMERMFTGSTSTSVAAHSPVPVHCVPAAWDAGAAPQDRVVVGIDGSEISHDVLVAGFSEARLRSAIVEVVHAWRPARPYDTAPGHRGLRAGWEQTARGESVSAVEEVAVAFPDVAWSLALPFDRVPVALHRAALDSAALVVGRHGRRTRFSLLVGSTTRALVRTATCPLLIVPGPAED